METLPILLTCESTQQIGWVSHENLGEIESIDEMIPSPSKQWQGAERFVPLNQVRRCQEWTAELIYTLWENDIREPLGPSDNGHVMPTFTQN